jgi:hypothetical protein
MTAVKRPFRLAVSDDEASRGRHAFLVVVGGDGQMKE